MSSLFKLVLVAALLVPSVSHSKAVAELRDNGIVVTLYDEPCAFTKVVNMEHRATWTNSGKTYEGCFVLSPGLVVGYFSDRSFALMPIAMFKVLTDI